MNTVIVFYLEIHYCYQHCSTSRTDLGHEPGDLIPLPNVNSRILKKVRRVFNCTPLPLPFPCRLLQTKSLFSSLKVLAWAEHDTSNTDSVAITPPSHLNPPSSPTSTPSPPTQGVPPFQPRPQPRVPQRTSRRVQPPPGHTLTQWEKEFITKNRDDIYELLLVRSSFHSHSKS